MENLDTPKLSDQICFPLYVIAKEITGMYRPFLDKLDITYSQYLVMMVLWENEGLTVNQIGEKLYLDSGTLTPLLKRNGAMFVAVPILTMTGFQIIFVING